VKSINANYYNDNDAAACAWLRELIKEGLIPNGTVDNRDIRDIRPDELKGFVQCHFFAGIGGWPYALQLAGWPTDKPVWTGSCPCQPYSVAGKGKGNKDDRHLWPDFFRLIRECKPDTVFGEQVAGAIKHGWLDGISADLEAEGYAVGACVLGAHSVGAPHIRQRLYWVANSVGKRRGRRNTECDKSKRRKLVSKDKTAGPGDDGGVADSNGQRREIGKNEGWPKADPKGRKGDTVVGGVLPGGKTRIIICRDGKRRRVPVEPSLFPLADGTPGRVGLLRGAGNAIVPQVAAEFIMAYMKSRR
jgi:DNA (cytosine-5)-methyltransferase 1